MKKLIKKKKNSYTEEEKIQAVRLLKENNFNHYLTSGKMSDEGEEGEKKGDSYNLIQQTIIACNSMNQQ